MAGKRVKLIELRGSHKRPKVAKEIGITPQMLGMIERGDRTPSLSLAIRIAEYYKVSVEDIFFDEFGHESFPNDHPKTERRKLA
ncbi:helix-turn-helix transcriptional regulator [Novibacillus thermophilus]|uniref:HTH cro/C1-type domain-containing protein n=1 Tax=Novibacillus thermophilus TaxID=1471761 RepID=A0A1U9K5D1_9BACL|nr:helix-turn-helix domain-containing protein [Novibacillus thermophilus]AQS55267.1 hypothetical protein B0W44_05215 [Novibacillus thermophilus]